MVIKVSNNGLWRIEREYVNPAQGSFAEESWEIRLIHIPSGKVCLLFAGEASGRVGHGNWDTEWSKGIDNLVFNGAQDGLIVIDTDGAETRIDFPEIEI